MGAGSDDGFLIQQEQKEMRKRVEESVDRHFKELELRISESMNSLREVLVRSIGGNEDMQRIR
jgi:hypothetical protein